MSRRVDAGHPEWMEWPTLGHKFGGMRLFRWPAYNGFRVIFRDWYFGNYLLVSLGWFAFACGGGIYRDAELQPETQLAT